MKSVVLGVVGIVAVFSFSAPAAAEAPPVKKADLPAITAPAWFVNLNSSDGSSIMSMECDGEAPFTEMYCHLHQVTFTRRTEEERARRMAEAMIDMGNLSKFHMAGYAPFFTDEDLKRLEQRAPAVAPEKREYLREFIDICKEISAVKTKVRPKLAWSKPDATKGGGCVVTSLEYEAPFKYAGQNKWVSTTLPGGLCNVVKVRTLENVSRSPVMWTLTEERTATIGEDLCMGVQTGKPVVYSAENPRELVPNCNYISSGW